MTLRRFILSRTNCDPL